MNVRKLNMFIALVMLLSLIAGSFAFPQSIVKAEGPTPEAGVISATTGAPLALKCEGNVCRIAFLMADSPTDRGWNAAHYRGIEQLKTLGTVVETNNLSFKVQLADGRILEVMVIEKVGYSDADIERVLRSVLNAGAQMVFGTWWDSQGPIARLAEEHADVLFEHCSGYPLTKSNGRNLSTYFLQMERDGDLVAGFVAGSMGISKVGLVSTFPIPEPVRGINAFFLGLQKGLKDAGLDPMSAEVRVVWTNSWLDSQKERDAALALIAEGFPAVRQMGDTPYASQAAAQEGILAIGYGTDVTPYASTAIMTNEWNWGDYYVMRVKAALDGTWKSHDWWGMGSNLVWGPKAPPLDIRQTTEKLMANIKGGYDPFCGPISGIGLGADGKVVNITVPQGKCLSDMDLLTMQWFVDGVKGEYPPAPPGGHKLELKDAK